MSPIMLPSASLTIATSLPPPTSLGLPMTERRRREESAAFSASRRRLGDSLQDDHRNDTLRPVRVVAEGREIVAVSPVQAIALRSLGERRGAHREFLGPDLNLGFPMFHQVVVPAGMVWSAALRRRDHVALASTVVDDRRRAHLACLCPTRRKEQKVIAPGPYASSALRVELVNDARVPVLHAQPNVSMAAAIPSVCANRREGKEGQT